MRITITVLALLAATALPASAEDPLGACGRVHDVTYETDEACAYVTDDVIEAGCGWTAVEAAGETRYTLYGMAAVVRYAAEVKVGCSIGDHYAETTAPGMAVTLQPAVAVGATNEAYQCEHVWARFLPGNPQSYDPAQVYVVYGRCFRPDVTSIQPWRIVTPS